MVVGSRGRRCRRQRECSSFQPLGQRVALQVLHDQEVDAVLTADVMERANVRVVQAGDGLHLALEPLLQIGVSGEGVGEDLQGNLAVELRVSGLPDLAL